MDLYISQNKRRPPRKHPDNNIVFVFDLMKYMNDISHCS